MLTKVEEANKAELERDAFAESVHGSPGDCGHGDLTHSAVLAQQTPLQQHARVVLTHVGTSGCLLTASVDFARVSHCFRAVRLLVRTCASCGNPDR
eukprot:6175656-Amphidinium_carterae.2